MPKNKRWNLRLGTSARNGRETGREMRQTDTGTETDRKKETVFKNKNEPFYMKEERTKKRQSV